MVKASRAQMIFRIPKNSFLPILCAGRGGYATAAPGGAMLLKGARHGRAACSMPLPAGCGNTAKRSPASPVSTYARIRPLSYSFL